MSSRLTPEEFPSLSNELDHDDWQNHILSPTHSRFGGKSVSLLSQVALQHAPSAGSQRTSPSLDKDGVKSPSPFNPKKQYSTLEQTNTGAFPPGWGPTPAPEDTLNQSAEVAAAIRKIRDASKAPAEKLDHNALQYAMQLKQLLDLAAQNPSFSQNMFGLGNLQGINQFIAPQPVYPQGGINLMNTAFAPVAASSSTNTTMTTEATTAGKDRTPRRTQIKDVYPGLKLINRITWKRHDYNLPTLYDWIQGQIVNLGAATENKQSELEKREAELATLKSKIKDLNNEILATSLRVDNWKSDMATIKTYLQKRNIPVNDAPAPVQKTKKQKK